MFRNETITNNCRKFRTFKSWLIWNIFFKKTIIFNLFFFFEKGGNKCDLESSPILAQCLKSLNLETLIFNDLFVLDVYKKKKMI